MVVQNLPEVRGADRRDREVVKRRVLVGIPQTPSPMSVDGS
jgi:hypothetical protein